MSRFQPGKSTNILYAAKNYASGLTDVKVSMYRMDGVAVFQDAIMEEILALGIYQHRFNMPTASGSYLIVANSDTEDKKDSALVYSGGFPGDPKIAGRGGGLVQRHLNTVWTQEEKTRLIDTVGKMSGQVDRLTEERDRLKEIVEIQKQLLESYKKALAMLKTLEDTSVKDIKDIKRQMDIDTTRTDIESMLVTIRKVESEVENVRGSIIKKIESIDVARDNKENDEETKKSIESMRNKLGEMQSNMELIMRSLPDEALDRLLEGDQDE